MNNEINEVLDSKDYEYCAKMVERNKEFEKGLEKGLKDLNYQGYVQRHNKVKTKMLKIGEDPELQKKYVHDSVEKLDKCLKTLTELYEESYWLEIGTNARELLMQASTSVVRVNIQCTKTDKRLNPEYYQDENDKKSKDSLDDMFKQNIRSL